MLRHYTELNIGVSDAYSRPLDPDCSCSAVCMGRRGRRRQSEPNWVFSLLGISALRGLTSYRKISRSHELARCRFRLFQSLRNLAGTSATALSGCLSNFKAMRYPTSNLTASRLGGETSCRLANRGPGIAGCQVSYDVSFVGRRLTTLWMQQGLKRISENLHWQLYHGLFGLCRSPLIKVIIRVMLWGGERSRLLGDGWLGVLHRWKRWNTWQTWWHHDMAKLSHTLAHCEGIHHRPMG